MKIRSAVWELFNAYRKVDVRTDERRCDRRYAWVLSWFLIHAEC